VGQFLQRAVLEQVDDQEVQVDQEVLVVLVDRVQVLVALGLVVVPVVPRLAVALAAARAVEVVAAALVAVQAAVQVAVQVDPVDPAVQEDLLVHVAAPEDEAVHHSVALVANAAT